MSTSTECPPPTGVHAVPLQPPGACSTFHPVPSGVARNAVPPGSSTDPSSTQNGAPEVTTIWLMP